MESDLVREVFSPWWKILIYMFLGAISIVSARLIFTFNLNQWLEGRRKDKQTRDLLKAAERCKHAWTLYSRSPYSVCSKCHVLISTSILLLARRANVPDLVIIFEDWTQGLTSPGGLPITHNYVGNPEG